MTDSRRRPAWAAPQCPNGHPDIYVDTSHRKNAEWHCYRCSTDFNQ